jgi:protein-tyrosine phosphatase
MRSYVADADLSALVEVESAGIGGWHVGDPADARSLRALEEAGYDGSAHRVRQFDAAWFARLDLVLALDSSHLEDLRALAPDDAARAKVRLLRSFDPEAQTPDVDDPFFGDLDGFDRVLSEVEAACAGLLTYVEGEVSRGAR